MSNEKRLGRRCGLVLAWSALILPVAVAGAKKLPAARAAEIAAFENGLVEAKPPVAETGATASPRQSLAQRMAFHKVPGVSVAVILDNRVAWAKGYGELTFGGGQPVTVDTLFEAASTTKAVVAAALLSYAEAGRFDLDADVNAYLKSWQIPDNEFTREQKVTLRRLLSNQGGLPMTDMGVDEKVPAPTLRQVMEGESPARNKPVRVEYVPGAKWQYSNVGYTLIQLILEDHLGLPLERILKEAVFAPLRMKASTVSYPLPSRLRSREAPPHDAQGHVRAPAMHPTALAQGGLMTTPGDLALFVVDLLRSYRGAGGRVLSTRQAKAMLHSEVELDPRLFGTALGEGLGIFVKGAGPTLAFLHPGNNYPGSVCWLVGYPERGSGVVVMLNGEGGEALAFEILAALGRIYGWPALLGS